MNKETKTISSDNAYAAMPLGAFLGKLYRVKKHVLADDPNKVEDFKVLEAMTVLGIDSLEIKALRTVKVIDGVEQVIINEDEELIFSKDKVFNSKITDNIESDKTILGDKKLATTICLSINKENLDKLQDFIEVLMTAESSLKTTINRQEEEIKEMNRR